MCCAIKSRNWLYIFYPLAEMGLNKYCWMEPLIMIMENIFLLNIMSYLFCVTATRGQKASIVCKWKRLKNVCGHHTLHDFQLNRLSTVKSGQKSEQMSCITVLKWREGGNSTCGRFHKLTKLRLNPLYVPSTDSSVRGHSICWLFFPFIRRNYCQWKWMGHR